MVRGTTPTFRLSIDSDIDLTEMDNVYATFQQGEYLVTKTGEDIEVLPQEVDVYFSQEETLMFNKGTVDIQLNWTFENGKRACSNIVNTYIGENLVGEVLE